MRRMVFNAEELEKYLFISDRFSFTDQTLENVSKDKLYSKIINQLKENSIKGFSTPIILFDIENNRLLTGAIYEDYTVHLYTTIGNSFVLIDMNYNIENDTLEITYEGENLLSEDYVKTLFGQGIVGNGDITMYRHELFINMATFIIYSPNQLNISSTQDLTTVVKPDNFSIFMGAIYSSDLPPMTVVLYYDNGIWKINDGSVTNVTTIKDHVIPL